MKDGPEGDVIGSRLERVELGADEDGDRITSCVIVPVKISETKAAEGPRLTKSQQTMFSILHGRWTPHHRAVERTRTRGRHRGRAARLIFTTPAWPLKPRDWFMKP